MLRNIETGQKTNKGRQMQGRGSWMDVNVRGRAPSYQEQGFTEGETADVPGARVGPSTGRFR